MTSKNSRMVNYENPKSPLLKIGRITQINYIPEGSTMRGDTEYYHIMGDTGRVTMNSNAILVTDSTGKNLYIVRDRNTSYPKFTDRGIIG
jgi:hypothetical protein